MWLGIHVLESFSGRKLCGAQRTTIGSWSTYEGYLSILESSLSDRCYDLDPNVYAGGLPFETFDYMHFGVGFAEMSSYMVAQYEEYAAVRGAQSQKAGEGTTH